MSVCPEVTVQGVAVSRAFNGNYEEHIMTITIMMMMMMIIIIIIIIIIINAFCTASADATGPSSDCSNLTEVAPKKENF